MHVKARRRLPSSATFSGAGDGIRTRDQELGKGLVNAHCRSPTMTIYQPFARFFAPSLILVNYN